MELKPGSRWKSAVCESEVVVVRAAKGDVRLECGGQMMIAMSDPREAGVAPLPEFSGGTLAGKRYVDSEFDIELLCTKAGKGSLAVNGRAATVKEAKKLPSSD